MIERRLRDRYSRQTMFPGIGEDGQAKLIDGYVVLIGCGALGCNIATLLVRAGVGRIKIIDRDLIEYHNLQRQVLFDEEDIRRKLPKAIAAERHLRNINSSVGIEGIVADVNYTNIEDFCRGADVILDGLDNIETRLLINDVSLKHKIPWIYGGAIASSGMTMNIIPSVTPCFRCFSAVIPEPGTMPTCETAGVIATAPAIIGSIQATEAMKILVGSEEINRKLIVLDVWRGTFDKFERKPRKDCPACQGTYEFLDSKYEIKTTSMCGQSRAVQVVNTNVSEIALDKLAAQLENVGHVNQITQNEFMLSFMADDHEIFVFKDGRTIVRNTIEESTAVELYIKYVVGNI